MWELHDIPVGRHSGQDVTYRKIAMFFYWSKLRAEVKEYVRSCDVCQRVKTGHQFPGGLLQPLPILDKVWEHISLDFIDRLPFSLGKDCIMVVVDRLTKVGHFTALSYPYSATAVPQLFLDNIYKLHGMPQTIFSDRDKLFTSHFWK